MKKPTLFMKKPETVFAMRFSKDNWKDCEEFGQFRAIEAIGDWKHENDVKGLKVRTPCGDAYAIPGDWILKNDKGEFWPCTADVFSEAYEVVYTTGG